MKEKLNEIMNELFSETTKMLNNPTVATCEIKHKIRIIETLLEAMILIENIH